MDTKERVDIIAKQTDIVYKKIFIFSVIGGGSWIYGIKMNGYIGITLWVVFMLASVGLVINLTKQGSLYRELEEIKSGKS